MNDQFRQLLSQYSGIVTEQHLQEVEAHELSFPSFSSSEALSLGLHVIEESKRYGEDILVMIFRERDDCVIFQYIMDKKRNTNIDYAQGKRRTVQLTKHSSLHAFLSLALGRSLPEVEDDANGCMPVGGAYPIIVDGEHVATLAVSGLHEGKDGYLLMEAVASYLKKDLPVYTGPAF